MPLILFRLCWSATVLLSAWYLWFDIVLPWIKSLIPTVTESDTGAPRTSDTVQTTPVEMYLYSPLENSNGLTEPRTRHINYSQPVTNSVNTRRPDVSGRVLGMMEIPSAGLQQPDPAYSGRVGTQDDGFIDSMP